MSGDIWTEMRDPETGGYVSGWGVIMDGAEVPRSDIEEYVTAYHGEGWERLVVEVQHLTFQPRVMWCSRHGSGWGCDREGEWHSHWHGVKHNNDAPDCCYTLALPVWPAALPSPALGAEDTGSRMKTAGPESGPADEEQADE